MGGSCSFPGRPGSASPRSPTGSRALGPVHDIARQAGDRLAAALAPGGSREAVFSGLPAPAAGRTVAATPIEEDAMATPLFEWMGDEATVFSY